MASSRFWCASGRATLDRQQSCLHCKKMSTNLSQRWRGFVVLAWRTESTPGFACRDRQSARFGPIMNVRDIMARHFCWILGKRVEICKASSDRVAQTKVAAGVQFEEEGKISGRSRPFYTRFLDYCLQISVVAMCLKRISFWTLAKLVFYRFSALPAAFIWPCISVCLHRV